MTKNDGPISIVRISREKSARLDQDILVVGNNPSAQRNEGAKASSSDWVLFLDDDSTLLPNTLEEYLSFVTENPKALVIGGPAKYKGDDTFFQILSTAFFESPLGTGPFHFRYTQKGNDKKCDDSKLILCNLMVKREFFLSLGGFDSNFYPNEENEFLYRVKKITDQIYYLPSAIVTRPLPRKLNELTKKLFKYGHFRAKNLQKQKIQIWRSIYLLPLMFTVLATICPILFFMVYIPFVMILCFKNFGVKKVSLVAPFFFLVLHYSYGVGLLSYYFVKKKKISAEPIIEIFTAKTSA